MDKHNDQATSGAADPAKKNIVAILIVMHLSIKHHFNELIII